LNSKRARRGEDSNRYFLYFSKNDVSGATAVGAAVAEEEREHLGKRREGERRQL
jgi:hypothetical protein